MGTRGVFAIIYDDEQTGVLVSERNDGKGWNLPGGRVETGENDHEALIREVREETGLIVTVSCQIGPNHVFNDDTAVAFLCSVVGGELRPTREAKQHRFVSAETCREITLVGPTDRLGRTGRMLWDGLSFFRRPVRVEPESPPEDRPVERIYVSKDGCSLLHESGEECYDWARLDPYSPTGKMEPQ